MESLGETGSSPRIDRMVARCKVAGAGRESQISFNSQPQAYRPLKLALNPVRLRLTVKRNTVQYFHKSRLLLVLGYLTTTH